MEEPSTEDIVRFAKCLATDPPKPYDRGWNTEATGTMPGCDGLEVWAVYYNWNEDINTLSRLRVFAKKKDEVAWRFIAGFNLDPPARTM